MFCSWSIGKAQAAEIASNGLGGGPWFDPATWRTKAVPGPGDEVVIQKNDIIVLDRADATCKKLLIDPRGALTFKPNGGKLTLSVSEGIESFGVIRLDGTKSATDLFELRLIGDTAAKRQVRLGKNAALLLYGRANLPEGKRNVVISSPNPADVKDKEPVVAQIEGDGQVMIDLLRAEFHDLKLIARKLDNTGAKPNERIKISDCRFIGPSRIYLEGCDTPEVSKNTFEYAGEKEIPDTALFVHSSPLAEVKHNRVKGAYSLGIGLVVLADALVTDNEVEKSAIGLRCYASQNVMVKQVRVRACPQGVSFDSVKGVAEDIQIEGSTGTGYYQQAGQMQVNHLVVKDVPKKALAAHLDTGSVVLFNANLLPADIKMTPQKPPEKPGPPPLLCQQCLIVSAKGAPAGSVIEVRTSAPALPAGAADPNVRNSPAPLVDGLTPLGNTLNPIVVNAWTFDLNGKTVAAPEYAIKVLGPAPKEGADRPVLKMMSYRPAENPIRASLDDKSPTLEVKLP